MEAITRVIREIEADLEQTQQALGYYGYFEADKERSPFLESLRDRHTYGTFYLEMARRIKVFMDEEAIDIRLEGLRKRFEKLAAGMNKGAEIECMELFETIYENIEAIKQYHKGAADRYLGGHHDDPRVIPTTKKILNFIKAK